MYNIFFLGAGFSRPAGLPLGDGLWVEILKTAKSKGLYESLKHTIYEYTEYYYGKTGEKITEEEVKLEEFMSYLDIDRQLVLKGGDYTAPEESFKNLMAYVLHSHERSITDEQFALYEDFAERLGLYDIIFTFNYDTILEKALKRKNMPYRLYPFRHKYDEKAKGLIVDGKEEVTILKMHGSINWFDKSYYQEWKDHWTQINYDREPPFAVFDGRMDDEIHRLLDEPFPQNDPLKSIYIAENLDTYFDTYFWYDRGRISDAPFIIAPSHHKLINFTHLTQPA